MEVGKARGLAAFLVAPFPDVFTIDFLAAFFEDFFLGCFMEA